MHFHVFLVSREAHKDVNQIKLARTIPRQNYSISKACSLFTFHRNPFHIHWNMIQPGSEWFHWWNVIVCSGKALYLLGNIGYTRESRFILRTDGDHNFDAIGGNRAMKML